MSTTLTRAEMEEKHGSVPPVLGTHFTWTISRHFADTTWTTSDGGETWELKKLIWAAERNRRDMEALEQQRIQRELKG
jgi:hypothetical protein